MAINQPASPAPEVLAATIVAELRRGAAPYCCSICDLRVQAATALDAALTELAAAREDLDEERAMNAGMSAELLRAAEAIKASDHWPENSWPSPVERAWHVAAQRELAAATREAERLWEALTRVSEGFCSRRRAGQATTCREEHADSPGYWCSVCIAKAALAPRSPEGEGGTQ